VPGYEILGELGRGGMGVVYLARQTDLRRLVALKMILTGPWAGEAERARFRAEAETVAHLHHPNVVQIYEVGEHDGRPYFALEFLEGGSLARRLNRQAVPADEAARLVETLARAVHHAHERGVIHRDLKPANVLLSFGGRPEGAAGPDAASGRPLSECVPKITDFGLAKRLEQTGGPTRTGVIVGTLSYMAPEQAAGQRLPLGPAVDAYGLGAILYELLTGRPPFEGEPGLALLRQVEGEEVVAPRRLRAHVPADVETICLKCLQKDPRKRYAAALDLADDLRRFQAGRPIQARRVGRLERCWKWARRNPALVGLLLVLTTGAVVSFLFALESRRKAAAESEARRQTRAALDEMSSQLIEDWLSRRGQLEPAQRAFLEKALSYYEAFAAQSGHTAEIRRGVAEAHLRVGTMRNILGQHPEAEAALRRAEALYASLDADFPGVSEHRRQRAASLSKLGTLLKVTGRPQEAEASHSQALGLHRQLAADFPDDPQCRQELASVGNTLGALWWGTGRPREAEAAFREALDVQQRLAADFPAEPRYQDDLAKSYGNQAILFLTTGRPREAEAAARQALAIQQRLVAGFPAVRQYRRDLAASYNNLAELFLNTGRPEEAESAYRECRVLLQRLAAAFPAVPQYRLELARCHGNLGNLLKDRGRVGEAEVGFRAARALQEELTAVFPTVPEYPCELSMSIIGLADLARGRKESATALQLLEEARPHLQAALDGNPNGIYPREAFRGHRRLLAETLLDQGAHAAAARAAGDLARATVQPGDDACKAAGIYCRCAALAEQDGKLPPARRQELARSYADEALTMLRQAVAKGFRDVAFLRQDKDLIPLRPHNDFQTLLAGLEEQATQRTK
jgi:tetratricopeptide (TPR) repeat protein